MRVAIVYPAFGVVARPNQPNIKAVADNYGVYPNIGLAMVAASALHAGHEVLFIDAMAERLSLNGMLGRLRAFRPGAMLFPLTTYLLHETLEVIGRFRAEVRAKVIAGGAQVTLYPEETLTHPEIDYGVIGEAEETIPELLACLESGGSPDAVRGIVYRWEGKPVRTSARPKARDLDSLPFPARGLLPMAAYYSFISRRRNYTILMSSRGCPMPCTFCEQRTGDIRYRSPENVAREFEECARRHGVREIDVFDPLFTLDRARVRAICALLEQKRLPVIWSCRSRVDTVDPETLQAMRRAGCYRIYFGIESGDEGVLRSIRKQTDLKKIRAAVGAAKAAGILAFGYFMMGAPGETRETLRKTVDLALSLPLDYAQFSRFSVLPGTQVYEEVRADLGFDYWRAYTLDRGVERPLPRWRCDLSDQELDAAIAAAYRRFYFRPGMLARRLLALGSPAEAARYARAALGMLRKPA